MTEPTQTSQPTGDAPQSMWLRQDRAEATPAPTGADAVWAAARASQAAKPAPSAPKALMSRWIDERDGGKATFFFGRTLPMPMYTVIFATLAVITFIEVIISELPEGLLGTSLLVLLSIAKAVLVILFYMHLRNDSRIFFVALLLPIIVATIATMFLLAVPTTGYIY
jgi:caa(3)-type oxidase subunit IV